MQTIIGNDTDLSKYSLANSVNVTMLEDRIELRIGGVLDLSILDLNINNATLETGVTPPVDWEPNKYVRAGGIWTDHPGAVSKARKQELIDQVIAFKDARLKLDLIYNGIPLDADDDLARLNGAKMAGRPNLTFVPKNGNSFVIKMTTAQFNALWNSIESYQFGTEQNAGDLIDSLNAAADRNELEAVDIDGSWPPNDITP